MPAANLPGSGRSACQIGLGDFLQELVRQGGQNAGAVARVRLAAAGAAVVHVAQHRAASSTIWWLRSPFDMGDEAHAAAVVLELRIVQSVLLGIDRIACSSWLRRKMSRCAGK